MARAIPGFRADKFREGIHLAMEMARPNDPELWPEFVREGRPVLDPAHADSDGVPWDPAAPVVRAPDVRVRALCALEMNPKAEDAERWGVLQPGSIIVTLLDVDYEQVRGFDFLNLWPAGPGEPTKYLYRRVASQQNLDTVGVWELECRTEDQV